MIKLRLAPPAMVLVWMPLVAAGSACRCPRATTSHAPAASEREQIDSTLDDFHAAAAVADEARYFDHFAPQAVFLGTDASERWTVEAFRAYVHPYFERGRGWTYAVRERHVDVFEQSGSAVAWFDERLENAKYGECRGSGVLIQLGNSWKLAQYNLSLPIPNELAESVVASIRALDRSKP